MGHARPATTCTRGIEAVRRGGAFGSAIEWLPGSAVLQATPRLSQYWGDAVPPACEALGDRCGPPDAPSLDAFNRFKLIYETACL